MLDPGYVRDHLGEVEARLRQRGLDPSQELAELAGLEADRRRLIPAVESLKRDQNAAGEEVARAKKDGRDPSGIFAENKARGAKIRDLETELAEVERKRDARLLTFPNLPHESVPAGTSSADNREVKTWGSPPTFDFTP
jgi:seryl-tRNA synthetase